MATTRKEALDQIVDLAQTHDITTDEIAARLISGSTKNTRGSHAIFKTIVAYLGGIFIFAGLSTLVGMFWDHYNSATRVIVSFGPGVIALIMGIATLKDPRYVKASTPLFLIAALLQPTGLFVFMNEYFSGDDAKLAAIIVFGPMALQMGLLFWALKRTNLLFLCLTFAFAFFWAAMEKLDIDGEIISLILGLSGLLITYSVNRTPYRAFTPFTYFIFAFCFAYGVFDLLGGAFPLDFLLIGIAAAMIYTSVLAQSRSLLVASVITMLGYLGYYTHEYFADMVSWPIALIIMGVIMLGLSSYAVKLGQNIRRG